jgi:hypothetical protein
VGVQEVTWDKEGTLKAGDYSFFLREGKWKSSVGNKVFCRFSIPLQQNYNWNYYLSIAAMLVGLVSAWAAIVVTLYWRFLTYQV